MHIARALVTRPPMWERKFLYQYKQVARRVVSLTLHTHLKLENWGRIFIQNLDFRLQDYTLLT
jgi:hypothetical protein